MKVLIADDDPHLRQGLTGLLEKQGYQCFSVTDGGMVLQSLPAFQPDLCIFDVMMPVLSGIELCASMRQQGQYQPILLLTAFDERVDQIEGFRLGADDYMTKPFNPNELLARVAALIRREQYLQVSNQTGNLFHLAKLEVESNQMLLRYQDQQVALSRRELCFLTQLRESQGRVLSKDEILDHCWGREYLPSSRVLDQFVAVLRKKIERQLGAPGLLETVYGVGY